MRWFFPCRHSVNLIFSRRILQGSSLPLLSSRINLKLGCISTFIAAHPHFITPFYGFFRHVLLYGTPALELNHGVIDRLIFAGMKPIHEALREEVKKWAHFVQPIKIFFSSPAFQIIIQVQIRQYPRKFSLRHVTANKFVTKRFLTCPIISVARHLLYSHQKIYA